MTRRMREGDVLIVRLVRRDQPVKRGFRVTGPAPRHHGRYSVVSVRLIRKKSKKAKRK